MQRGAADLLKIEKANLAMKIHEANSYDVRVLLDFVDLVGEMLNNPMNRKNFESVKLSRINASVMNRRSVVSERDSINRTSAFANSLADHPGQH